LSVRGFYEPHLQSPCAQVQLERSVINQADIEKGVEDDVRGGALTVGGTAVLINWDLDVRFLRTTISQCRIFAGRVGKTDHGRFLA